MANVLGTLFTDIANSIRSKTGSTDKMSPSEFPSQIDSIQGSGGGIPTGYKTVTFMNGDNVLFERLVLNGDDCPDPLTQGRIETPTKESTVQYNYTFNGWSATNGGAADSNALKNITEDKVLYSAFAESDRLYTVNFYDGNTLIYTEQVAYGGNVTYTPDKKDNYLFMGWTPEPTNITDDLDCVAIWEESYAFADASWEYINQMSQAGKAAEAFAVGDTKIIQITAIDGSIIETPVQIVGFNHDNLADGTGKAGISIVSVHSLNERIFLPSSEYFILSGTTRYLSDNGLHNELNNEVYNSLSPELRNYIKPVTKTLFNEYKSSDTIGVTVDANIWALGVAEVSNVKDKPYKTSYHSDGELYEYFQTPENRKKYVQYLSGVEEVYVKNSSPLIYGTRSMVSQNGSETWGGIICKNGNIATSTASSHVPIGFCI